MSILFSRIKKSILLFVIIECFFTAATFSQPQLQPIGEWREHTSYNHVKQVVQGSQLYAATSTNVFAINTENEAIRYSKVNGLNDVGVSCIGYDNTKQQLIIAYNNSNIDVLKNEKVINIRDVLRSQISPNKRINRFFVNNGLAYAASEVGIIVVNLQRYEIADTWVIGNNGNFTTVNAVVGNANAFWAATTEGLKQCNSNVNSVLRNFNNWQTITGNGLQAGSITNVALLNGNIVIQKNDTIFINRNNTWQILYTAAATTISNMQVSNNKLLLCITRNNTTASVLQLNDAGIVEQTYQSTTNIQQPNNAIIANNTVFIADGKNGLLQIANNTITSFTPDGPFANTNAAMAFLNDTLIVTSGSITNNFSNTNNKNGFYNLAFDTWKNTNHTNRSILDTVVDVNTVATNAITNQYFIGSFGGGLLQVNGNNISVLKRGVLQPAINNANAFNVSGLAFDNSNNLWISNYGAAQPIKVRQPNNNMVAYNTPFVLNNNAVSGIVVDDINQLWIVSPFNGLLCFNNNNTLQNIADDKWKLLRLGVGSGGLPSNNVLSIAKDKNGFIWIGTDKGIAIVQCPTEVFTQNCEAILPIVQQDQFAGFLFQNEVVQTIAVDGANRKWIGTQNGVWLISADGDKIIYRFSDDNSPLLSNNVQNIVIQPQTGEVFFGTDKGICSFRSTATEQTEALPALVFPNPVPPNYSGTIAIRGVPTNSIVKITEPNGQLIFQTRSNGTQAVWNGKNYKGETINSGVYLVFAQSDNGTEKLVTKIVFIGR